MAWTELPGPIPTLPKSLESLKQAQALHGSSFCLISASLTG